MRFLVRRLHLAAALLLAAGNAAAADDPSTWRLDAGLEHRVRYETLTRQFRAGARGGDQVLALRTLLSLEAARGAWSALAEISDSRIALDDAGTPVNNSLVDELDLLQGYLRWQGDIGGAAADLKLGRQTLDLGSRRLVARNRFRNTINSFTGADLSIVMGGGWQLNAFFLLPVNRLPSARADIDDHELEFDDEDGDVRFAGLFFTTPQLFPGTAAEFYLYHLHEDDSGSMATRNRRLLTPGVRLFSRPAANALDFELELTGQFGESRGSTAAADVKDLDHRAALFHAQLGYTFAAPFKPRFLVQFDYASGDDDPADGRQGSFDTLYGARRSEFGPTGIWGPFARTNLVTPGWRLEMVPAAGIKAMIAHRGYWLADRHAPWAAAGLNDPAGNSGRYLGQQVEARLQWEALPDHLSVELGWAHYFRAGFAERAPAAPEAGDSDYFYSQLTLAF